MVLLSRSTVRSSGESVATMVGGRLVYATSKPILFSWLRCVVVISVLLYLHITNPANFYSSSKPPKQQSKPTILGGLWDSVPSSVFERRRTTNYWLFSVKERTTKSIVTLGGINLDCFYDNMEYPMVGVTICQNVIQQYMTHQKPLLYHPNDYAYTTHRCVAWILFISAIVSLCFTNPLVIQTSYILLDSLASFVLEQSQQSSLVSLVNRLVLLNVLIYPVLQAMDTTVKQQSPDSIFFISKTDGYINYCFSLFVWIGLAVAMNAASKSWTGQFLLQFQAIAAVGMGYYARYQDSGMAPLWDWMVDPEEADETWTFITWTIIIILATRGSVATAIFWCLAHCTGQMLYQYQFDHLVLIATARSLTKWINSVGNTIQQLLFGRPHHQKVTYR
jgi:hypothetical protein